MAEINRNPNDPNKGMNIRTYLISVLITVVVILIAAVLVVSHSRTAAMPSTTQPLRPHSASPQ